MNLNYVELLREVGAHFSVNRMLTAECYKQRMERGLSFLEFNYMIMQSYDFYMLYQKYGCNMQFGGDDQWSNMLGGTELIRRKLGKDAHAMTITLLLNSEGNKMGKTGQRRCMLDPERLPRTSSTSTGEMFPMQMCSSACVCSHSCRWSRSMRWITGGKPVESGKRDPRIRADKSCPRRRGSETGAGERKSFVQSGKCGGNADSGADRGRFHRRSH